MKKELMVIIKDGGGYEEKYTKQLVRHTVEEINKCFPSKGRFKVKVMTSKQFHQSLWKPYEYDLFINTTNETKIKTQLTQLIWGKNRYISSKEYLDDIL